MWVSNNNTLIWSFLNGVITHIVFSQLNSKLTLLKKTTILTKPSPSPSSTNNQTNPTATENTHPTNTTDSLTTNGTNELGTTQLNQLPKDENYGGYTRRSDEPVVKILRRPEHERSGPVVVKAKQVMKSLQQREAEYAEARLRILGAACPSEEPPVVTPAPIMWVYRRVGLFGFIAHTPKTNDTLQTW